VDHDRFEWLLTYLFRRRMQTGEGSEASIGAQLLDMFPTLAQTPLTPVAQENLSKLLAIVEEIKSYTNLLQLTSSRLVTRGRELKESFGEERHRPAVLAAVVKYNLLLGREFRVLFERVAQQNRELAAQLATADYRGNVEPLHELATATQNNDATVTLKRPPALTPNPPPVAPAATASVAPSAPAPFVPGRGAVAFASAGAFTGAFESEVSPITGPQQDNVQHLVERRRLRSAMENLATHFSIPEHKVTNSINVVDAPLAYEDWEARALTTNFPKEEKSFRAEFARTLKDAGVLLYRIAEEKSQLKRKNHPDARKPHEESLSWLYAQAQAQVQTLRQFAEDIGKRGLPEKQQQILLTALRLSDVLKGRRLRTTADPFGETEDASLLTHPDEILSPKRAS
jgi:hypothetical protein